MKTAAQEIRQILKQNFETKFSVRKRGYNCIDVDWENGPTVDEVDSLIGQFKMGNFDGMTDSYDYSNRRKDIPQVEYLFLQRSITEEVYDKAFEITKKFFAGFDKCENVNSTLPQGNAYFLTPKEILRRFVCKINLKQELSLDVFKSEFSGEHCELGEQ